VLLCGTGDINGKLALKMTKKRMRRGSEVGGMARAFRSLADNIKFYEAHHHRFLDRGEKD